MTPMPFGEYLASIRKRAGLSQRAFAAELGLHHTYISKVENGHLPPFAPETIQKAAEVLMVRWECLFYAAGLCTACKGSGHSQGQHL